MSNANDFVIENGVLTQYSGSDSIIEIPECVTEIGEYVFSEAGKITKVIFPQGLTKIGRESFSKCRKLEEVVFPQSLKEIDSQAFYLCRKLKSVEVPGSCESTGSCAFWGCSGLETLVINEGVKEIGYCSFADCTTLSQIRWPNSLKTIWHEAFSKCKSLTEVVLPAGVEQVYPSAFGDCTSVDKVMVSKAVLDSIDAKWFRSRFNNVDLNFLWLSGKTNFDERVGELCTKSILRKKDEYAAKIIRENGAQAMESYLSLLGKVSVETLDRLITDSSTAGAAEVTAVLLDWKTRTFAPVEIEQATEDIIEKKLGIKAHTVADWRNVFRFSTVEGKVVISAYKGNDTEVTIPAKIGKNDVSGFCLCHYQGRKMMNEDLCGKITRVTIEQGVMRIDDRAFMKCRSLRFLEIPSGVTSIGYWAFFLCEALEELWIPASVTEIHWGAISNCPKLTIHAPAGSTAEAYAKENNIPFVAE